jgi:hypothetical protein
MPAVPSGGSILPHAIPETQTSRREFGCITDTTAGNGDGEKPMGVNDSRRQSCGVNQCTPHLPRHIIEHIGQVLRNRAREDLLIPVPGEILDRLKRMRPAQGWAPARPGVRDLSPKAAILSSPDAPMKHGISVHDPEPTLAVLR